MIYLHRLAAHCGIRFSGISIALSPPPTSPLKGEFHELKLSKKRKISWARRKNLSGTMFLMNEPDSGIHLVWNHVVEVRKENSTSNLHPRRPAEFVAMYPS
ncbi:uncharacterized protein LACBIDRAFT_329065 [Laccaria bicolor S238N-H82]|uniref:Predicted protein n=1 Tax=Laccaria bicolor (strain S238N-H82 / ATCC MYA-4686) TaxID=486041 RepID=B0DGY2_LACBS|nr:uncharacterized protein LACBIDRAFT_329065 [Laccaria bicolor S238N-H82]EDR06229.1 predicted protein [Laccaria bicolor S238N-H82]|eukprot:XP_001883090.1 predicted protein [Laccaria bicolor S238N-H82]